MKKRTIIIVILITSILILLLSAAFLSRQDRRQAVKASLISEGESVVVEGFTQATGPQALTFPADYGPHPDFQTEWWYYTGNLSSQDGQHFGYQLTFFRRALLPSDQNHQRDSKWSTNQVFMAHFALTDVSARRHQAYERLERNAASLAGAQAEPFQVWLWDWQIEEIRPGSYQLKAAEKDLVLNLNLTNLKGPILHGDQGYSQKGPDAGNASYYFSQPRLATDGTIQTGGQQYTVSGLSWMDHEWSTSALSSDQVGWDWFSIQLVDGSELMVFQIRNANGEIDSYSSGTLIESDGSTRHLSKDNFIIDVLDTWTSPDTQANYPARWRIEIPAEGIKLEIEPYLTDQELNVSYNYWEGAVKASGWRAGQYLEGDGYVELTGYAGSMGGKF
jgi:predicted secreted hydrolase